MRFKQSSKLAAGVAIAVGLGLGAATVIAGADAMGPGMMHRMGGDGPGAMHGPMGDPMAGGMHGPMGGPMAGGMQQDNESAADMRLVHEMIASHDKIKRTVTNLPNGIRTETASADPAVAQAIKAHVASMEGRLADGRVFNLFSPTLPVLFANKDKIRTQVQTTAQGTIVTQISDDPVVVTALQAHAVEVSELARDGMIAMMRSARASIGR